MLGTSLVVQGYWNVLVVASETGFPPNVSAIKL